MKTRIVSVGPLSVGGNGPLAIIAGPCVIEAREIVLETAKATKEICKKLELPFIFKSSFDKANRTSIRSFRGPGIEAGLNLLAEIKESLDLPILVDIHEASQIEAAASVADILQIPAFLCRQTDLLLAVSKSGRTVNVKKGQFLSPWEMQQVVDKIASTGNENILLTERGVSFGYNNLVVDMRSFPVMRKTGYPVIYDATHSLQLPGAGGDHTGGQRKFIPYVAKAAVAAGVDGIFMEVHPEPAKGLCDAANMYPLDKLELLLRQLKEIHELNQSYM